MCPPSTAENLSVGRVTNDSITLEWEQGNREAAQYKIYRRASKNSSSVSDLVDTVEAESSDSLTYTDNARNEGLDSNTSYDYYIISVGKTGIKSTASSTVTAETLPENLDTKVDITGIDSEETYIAGYNKTLSADVSSEKDAKYNIKWYRW